MSFFFFTSSLVVRCEPLSIVPSTSTVLLYDKHKHRSGRSDIGTGRGDCGCCILIGFGLKWSDSIPALVAFLRSSLPPPNALT